ncbi:MAG TPA: hypothetical protein VK589_21270 [Chryseolinea sp.]|nr:hypothetical protein [Chryseolinea sp.]
MIKLNVNKVLEQREIERQKPKPLPKLRIKGSTRSPIAQKILDETHSEVTDFVKEYGDEKVLLHQLEREYGEIRMERNKLSSQICMMVEGGASQEQLKDLYQQIEGYRIPLQQHYDKIAFVKQHGALPEIKTEAHHEETIFELKDKKRKLVDKRCKLQIKLQKSAKPSKPAQVANWELELEKANAEYNDVERRLKVMEGKA